MLVRNYICQWRGESLVDKMPKHKILDCILREDTFCVEALQSCHVSSAVTHFSGRREATASLFFCLLTEQLTILYLPWLQQDY